MKSNRKISMELRDRETYNRRLAEAALAKIVLGVRRAGNDISIDQVSLLQRVAKSLEYWTN